MYGVGSHWGTLIKKGSITPDDPTPIFESNGLF